MEELYREGRIRAIGVSNFHPDRLMDLMLHNEIAPAVNQVETHPFHQQTDTQKFLQENGVQMESWGPFAEGRNDLFHNELLRSIGETHGKSIENFDVFDFELTPDEMSSIATLDTGTSAFFDHRDPAMVKWLSEAKRPT